MPLKTINMKVSGMSCEHCKKAVEDALMTLEGVESAKVDLQNNNVSVGFDDTKTDENKIKAAISNAGYEVK